MKPKELGQLFLQHYPVDENGYSEIALMEDLIEICPDFKTKNGCQWARSGEGSWLGKQFEIERKHKYGNTGAVISVQLVGFRQKQEYHNIPNNIRQSIDKRCRVLDIGTNIEFANIELDHKDATYQTKELTVDDFQPLCKTVNDAKRQHCKECRENGIRFDAKRIGSNISYSSGDAYSNTCIGCYWNDTYDFWQKVTRSE